MTGRLPGAYPYSCRRVRVFMGGEERENGALPAHPGASAQPGRAAQAPALGTNPQAGAVGRPRCLRAPPACSEGVQAIRGFLAGRVGRPPPPGRSAGAHGGFAAEGGAPSRQALS